MLLIAVLGGRCDTALATGERGARPPSPGSIRVSFAYSAEQAKLLAPLVGSYRSISSLL